MTTATAPLAVDIAVISEPDGRITLRWETRRRWASITLSAAAADRLAAKIAAAQAKRAARFGWPLPWIPGQPVPGGTVRWPTFGPLRPQRHAGSHLAGQPPSHSGWHALASVLAAAVGVTLAAAFVLAAGWLLLPH